ncbi:TFIIB-type zinc finger domain-containing protein [Aspergillus saccharolyticus JOP 1030-1]|uniref:RNA polymerase I-specific transcription initiation factor Rrn7 n=1 Tax=Aspergillus saccharolyticus JOP 1030-1 TaxID=1450539 RepID=A0A318Z292_9EURO|nr:RNA polymerase I-specific transcription initiation factor Rrn7 [Aspergillus saccharolyticus JOP 1030-1]PYH41405.1 RNA polymerase I-specific transcription initiation factor Rrn7 [Aspergillus saccharolyticus JOP 1030-1]
MEYITRGVCGQEGCRETRYYIDNGLWFCRRGHQQEGRQVEDDADDFNPSGRTSRIKKAAAEKAQRTYQGRQASRLFLQVYQLILWKQSSALVQSRGFPPEFENVVRDLWALHLNTFADQINELSEQEDEPRFFSSQPASSFDESTEAKLGTTRTKWPRLIDSLALCYLAALLMRLPVSVEDFHRMAIRGEMPFIRVIKDIPREMRDRLPQHFIAIIETTKLIRAEHLHGAVADLLSYYHNRFDMKFPALNWPFLLYRYIRRLALPIDLYAAVKRLRPLLGFSFEYPKGAQGRRRPLRLPEVQIVVSIVIATKLFFPFDDYNRYPVSSKEPSVQVIDWALWAQNQRLFDREGMIGGWSGKGKQLAVTEKDILDMTPSQMDEYMNWYERSWLDHSKAQNPLAEFFPLNINTNESQTAGTSTEDNERVALLTMLRTSTSQLKLTKVIAGESIDTPRPGSAYARYRTEADLPDTARPFFETTAKVAGVSLSTLVRAVSQAEHRLTRWLEGQRRVETMGDALDTDFSTEDSELDDYDMPESEPGE